MRTLLRILKKWWFWLCVLALCSIPKYDGMSVSGEYYLCGKPFPAFFVKHGDMGIGGRLSEGVLYIPDGSPPENGYRTGWFIQANLISIGLNIAISLLVVYGFSHLWRRIRHEKQHG